MVCPSVPGLRVLTSGVAVVVWPCTLGASTPLSAEKVGMTVWLDEALAGLVLVRHGRLLIRVHHGRRAWLRAVTSVRPGRPVPAPAGPRRPFSLVVAPDVSDDVDDVEEEPEAEPGRDDMVDVGPTRRRLQALGALGWPMGQVSSLSGEVTRTALLGAQRRAERMRCRRSTAVAVARIYSELAGAVPPDGPQPRAARDYAARHGWVGPDGWTDIDAGVPAGAEAVPA